MPVSYEAANLLKCTVSMNYIRYTVKRSSDNPSVQNTNSTNSPLTNSIFNPNFLTQQFLDQNGGFTLPSLNIA